MRCFWIYSLQSGTEVDWRPYVKHTTILYEIRSSSKNATLALRTDTPKSGLGLISVSGWPPYQCNQWKLRGWPSDPPVRRFLRQINHIFRKVDDDCEIARNFWLGTVPNDKIKETQYFQQWWTRANDTCVLWETAVSHRTVRVWHTEWCTCKRRLFGTTIVQRVEQPWAWTDQS